MAAEARAAAERLLARREHSERELGRKLAARGFAAEEIAAALAELRAEGWQSDRRFAEELVRSRLARGAGPLRIAAELRDHGIDEALAAELIPAAQGDGGAAAVRRKRFGAVPPRDFKERARQARFLHYRGFNAEQIRAALGDDPGAGADDFHPGSSDDP